MNTQENAIAKIRQLPEPLLKLVNDFLDVLLKFNLPSEAPSSITAPAIPDPPKPVRVNRKPGSAKHLITYMADDFNDPLEDFREYME